MSTVTGSNEWNDIYVDVDNPDVKTQNSSAQSNCQTSKLGPVTVQNIQQESTTSIASSEALTQENISSKIYSALETNDPKKIKEVLLFCKTEAAKGNLSLLKSFIKACIETKIYGANFKFDPVLKLLKTSLDRKTYLKAVVSELSRYYRSGKSEFEGNPTENELTDLFFKDVLDKGHPLIDLALSDEDTAETFTILLQSGFYFNSLKGYLLEEMKDFSRQAIDVHTSNEPFVNFLKALEPSAKFFFEEHKGQGKNLFDLAISNSDAREAFLSFLKSGAKWLPIRETLSNNLKHFTVQGLSGLLSTHSDADTLMELVQEINPSRVAAFKHSHLPKNLSLSAAFQEIEQTTTTTQKLEEPSSAQASFVAEPFQLVPVDAQHLKIKFSDLKAKTAANPPQLLPNSKAMTKFGDVPLVHHNILKADFSDEKNLPLHANYLTFESQRGYIAAQSPKAVNLSTVSETVSEQVQGKHNLSERFIMSAVQNNTFIVDLTGKDELKGTDRYYPRETDKTLDLRHNTNQNEHGLTIKQISSSKVSGITANILDNFYQVDGKYKLERLHFLDWKDFKASSLTKMHELVKVIETKRSEGKTPMIHCRAGIGRTGTTIVASELYHLKTQNKLTQENYMQTIENLILQGRSMRGPLFVQSSDQYISIVRYAEALLSETLT